MAGVSGSPPQLRNADPLKQTSPNVMQTDTSPGLTLPTLALSHFQETHLDLGPASYGLVGGGLCRPCMSDVQYASRAHYSDGLGFR
jgi:hypothetical protein